MVVNSQFNSEVSRRVVVAMLGARMHYAVPRLLHEAGLLERFFTDSYIGSKPWLEALLRTVPAGIAPPEVVRWLGRKDDALPTEKVTSFDLLGMWYACARSRSCDGVATERVFEVMAKRFSSAILRRGLGRADVVWGFNTASLDLFRAAKAKGMRCILEQTSLPSRLDIRLMEAETTRWPGWELTRGHADADPVVFGRDLREEREWELADRNVAGSHFVRSGLLDLGVPDEKISVVPYGVDVQRFPNSPVRSSVATGRALRILFAGSVNLRKGVPDLLHALDSLPPGAVDVRLAGAVTLNEEKLARWRDRVEFLGAVPRSHMNELYQWADVFVLPSVSEGSATVTYEALMSGVPVITTANAGSIVRDGVDGVLVPIRDSGAIARALQGYRANPRLLEAHTQAAFLARDRAGLERYGRDLAQLVREVAG